MPLSENMILLITLLIKIHKPFTMASQNNSNLNYHQSYTVTGMNCVKFDDMIVKDNKTSHILQKYVQKAERKMYITYLLHQIQ
jgi:hypothetical protein